MMKNRSEPRRLYRVLLIAGLLGIAANCSSQPEVHETTEDKPAAAELVAQSDKLYAQRAELARAREGILLLRRALGSDSNNYDAAWRLARLNYYLGAHTDNTSERDKAYNDGIEAGRRAIKLQDGKPEGHFWLGANLGGKAQTSMLSGLSAVSEIRTEMQRVIQLDEGFQSGSAYMALGQVELETPKMLGGDSAKAVEILEKGLRFSENNTLYHLRLAQAYLAVSRKADARKQLEIIINATPNPEFLPEHQEAVTEAKKLLEKTS
jgi:Tfp pilus assembly protein PilF